MNTGFQGFSGLATPLYNPDLPPFSPSEYNDEFDDGIVSGWVLSTTYTPTMSLGQSATTRRMSESIIPGCLLVQGDVDMINDYRPFSPPITQPFTVVAKVSIGVWMNTTDRYCSLSIRGDDANRVYHFMAGRAFGDAGFRTVYNNNAGFAEGVRGQADCPLSVYLMITHDGSKNFSAFMSGDGIGWSCLELNRNLSSFTQFTRLGLMQVGSTSAPAITAWHFVRYFPVAGQFLIGRCQ
jgi:hypothetical protein